MTETVKKDKAPRKPNFVKKEVMLKGKTKFTTLKTPDEKFDSYQIAITVSDDDPQLEMLKELRKEAIAFERAQITKAKQDDFVDAPRGYAKVDVDKDGNETGLVLIKASRKGKDGAPGVFSDTGRAVDKHIIERGSDVEVHVTARSYVAPGGMIGMTLQLHNVMIIREEPSSFVPGKFTPDDAPFAFKTSVEKEMGEDDSPFGI
jgi:hypothetical protein